MFPRWEVSAWIPKIHTYKVQGILYWNGVYELALMYKDIQVRFGLQMVLECCDITMLGPTTIFQKSNISWPQQLPKETEQKFKMIFSILIYIKKISAFQNIKIKLNSRTGMALNFRLRTLEFLSSDFSGPSQKKFHISAFQNQFINSSSIWDTLYIQS